MIQVRCIVTDVDAAIAFYMRQDKAQMAPTVHLKGYSVAAGRVLSYHIAFLREGKFD